MVTIRSHLIQSQLLENSSFRGTMSTDSFWSAACNDAEGRPLQTLLRAAYLSYSATVRHACAAVPPVAVAPVAAAAADVPSMKGDASKDEKATSTDDKNKDKK